MVYSRTVGEKVLRFGVSGMLLKNALIMFDYETRSLWPVMMNRSVKGEMKGTRLQELPVVSKTTWGAWKAAHPETKVLSVEGVVYEEKNVYAERFAEGKGAVRPIENEDDRLKELRRVIGVFGEGAWKAYPLDVLQEAVVIADRVGETPVVLAARPGSEAVGVFDRRLVGEGGAELEFTGVKEGRLVDGSGTSWDLVTGAGVGGEHDGKTLTFVPAKNVFWYIWADYYPETDVYAP